MNIFDSNAFHMACFNGDLEKVKSIIENDSCDWWLSCEMAAIQETVIEEHIPILDFIIDNYLYRLLESDSEIMLNNDNFRYQNFFYDIFHGEVKSSQKIKKHIINKALLNFHKLDDKSSGKLLVQSLELAKRTRDAEFFKKVINDTLPKFHSLSSAVKEEEKPAYIKESIMVGHSETLQIVVDQLAPDSAQLSKALSHAIMIMDDDLVSFLIAHGADISTSVEGHLVQIVVKKDMPLLKYIMRNFGDEVSKVSYLALRRACYIGNLEAVELFVKSGTSIISPDGNESCFRQAACQGHQEVLKFLCDKTKNKHVDEKYEALVMACGHNQLATAKYLIEEQSLSLLNDSRLLESAIKGDAFDVVDYLYVKHGLTCKGLDEYFQRNNREKVSKKNRSSQNFGFDSSAPLKLKKSKDRVKQSDKLQWEKLDITYEEMENRFNHSVDGLKFLRLYKDGDQFWKFRSPSWTWEKLCGREGYAIKRKGQVISSIVTIIS